MSDFRMTLALDDAAWRNEDDDTLNPEALALVLEDAAEQIRNGTRAEIIGDINGNRCGSWTINNDEGDAA